MKKVLFLIVYCFLSVAGFVQSDVDEKLYQVPDWQKLAPLQKLLQPVAKVEFWRILHFDRTLSSNKGLFHTTYHHPGLQAVDSLSLSMDVHRQDVSKLRKMGEDSERVPLYAPKIFNRGAEAGIPCFGRVY